MKQDDPAAKTPNPQNYDLDFRPKSYWGPSDVKTHFSSRIKGELRRQTALQELELGVADQGMLQSALGAEERRAVGAVHPWYMGGEYLADLFHGNAVCCELLTQAVEGAGSVPARVDQE